MQTKIRIVAVIVVFAGAIWFAASWFIGYQQRSRASAAPPTLSLTVADAKQVTAGNRFDLNFVINPNSTPFYSFNVTFKYDPAKVGFSEETDLESNIERLKDDVILTKKTIDIANNTIHVEGLRQGVPFIGGEAIPVVKFMLKMKDGAALPLVFEWTEPTKLDITTIDKKNYTFNGELSPTPAPTGQGPVTVPTATPPPTTGGGPAPTATPIPIRCGNLLCPSGQTCVTFPLPTCTTNGICGEGKPPQCSGAGGIPIDPVTGQPVAGFGGSAGGGPKPPIGTAGPVAQTIKIYNRADRLYINSLTTYQAPFRYQQKLKLEKGQYSLVVGGKVVVQRGAGMVMGLICNETTCGSKKKNEFIYVSPRFPQKDEYSEMREKVTIPDDANNKEYMFRVFCEDGSECDIDYIQFEDAWGNDRMVNPQFAQTDTMNNLRIQPAAWEYDETANLYGSIDPASGKDGALVINNSAQ